MVAILAIGSFSCSLEAEMYCTAQDFRGGVGSVERGYILYRLSCRPLGVAVFPCDVPGLLMCSANQSALD